MTTRGKQGFASMDPEKQKQISSMGGKACHQKGTGYEFSPEAARLAGQKGGHVTGQNREHMVEIGRKGGVSRARKLAEEKQAKLAGGKHVGE